MTTLKTVPKLTLNKETLKTLNVIRTGLRAGGGTVGADSDFCTFSSQIPTKSCDGGAPSKPYVR